MLWDRVGLRVVGWVGARGGACHSWHKPTSIIINYKITRPSSISTLGYTSRSAKMNSQFLRNHNKSGRCSPKHKLVSEFLVSL